MNVLTVRNELRKGRPIFDLPLRVTFYARVSTDKDEQLNSLENQVQYYTELIQSKPNWTYVPGYIDEGISGTSTKRRDSFLRMIRDAKSGKFDFIITKEISRFSRSTLDSIQYTQELLEHDVGVLFQNDNINTMDADSEFRLTIMAGVAQDEVRKLSERLKFGFHQAIQNGHVLGNSQIWGYNKKGCVLTVNEQEAYIVRRIFDLYANRKLGIRKISQKLYEEGFTSRKGNAFNELTIRHILCNPKYKGWYCAGKTKTVDYRSKRKVFLGEEEWVMYRDPQIPALVPEELWDRANALYKLRSSQAKSHTCAADYHSRYAYSGKILCEIHRAHYQRKVLKSKKGDKEAWECKRYHQRGKAGCSSPQLRTQELNQVMARIFQELAPDKEAIVREVLRVIRTASEKQDNQPRFEALAREMEGIRLKKDRLLEMSLKGILSTEEFKQWNDGYNQKLQQLKSQQETLGTEQLQNDLTTQNMENIKAALEEELSFQGGVHSELAASILDHVVVKQGSTPREIHLEIHLKGDTSWAAVLGRETSSLRITRF